MLAQQLAQLRAGDRVVAAVVVLEDELALRPLELVGPAGADRAEAAVTVELTANLEAFARGEPQNRVA